MQVREKVAKSRITVLFQWFVAPEGRKVGSLTLSRSKIEEVSQSRCVFDVVKLKIWGCLAE
jgi:hypothetical protein